MEESQLGTGLIASLFKPYTDFLVNILRAVPLQSHFLGLARPGLSMTLCVTSTDQNARLGFHILRASQAVAPGDSASRMRRGATIPLLFSPRLCFFFGPPMFPNRLHHMDLYRLQGGTDLRVLGIPGVFETCVCLVEWPDRLGATQPVNRLGEKILRTFGLSSVSAHIAY